MPARRSRTEHWRESLQQLHERNGAIEISLPGDQERFRDAGGSPEGPAPAGDVSEVSNLTTKNLVWRVRILQLTNDAIIVEQPMVLRQRIDLEPGIELVGVIAMGPNRWMFRTRNLGRASVRAAGMNELPAIRLALPDRVERCQRRSFYRISTVGLLMPRTECYPLLDPHSVVAAEAANRADILDRIAGVAPIAGRITPAGADTPAFMLPEVGPGCGSTLVNIGGGGAGLLVDPLDASIFDRHKIFWLRVNLTPQVPAPLGITARVVHTHLDTTQRTYAGMAFDFSFNRSHEQFVVNQLCRYVADVQRDQLRRQSAAG